MIFEITLGFTQNETEPLSWTEGAFFINKNYVN